MTLRSLADCRSIIARAQGVRRVLVIGGDRDYIRPERGFSRDAEALRGDNKKVVRDLAGLIRSDKK